MESANTLSHAPKPGPGAVRRLTSGLWWEHAIAFSWQFRSHLKWTAICFLLFGVILAPVFELLETLRGISDQVLDAGPFLVKLGMITLGLATAGVFFLCGMFLGILKLTAFTRAFLAFPLPENIQVLKDPLYKEKVKEIQAEAMVAMSKHKAYLGRAWLLAFVAMVPLCFVVGICMGVYMVLADPKTAGLPVPEEARAMLIYFQIAMLLAMVILNNYSVVTLAVTSLTNRTVGDATRKSLLLTVTSAPLLTLVSAVVMVLTTVITTPHAIVEMIRPSGSITQGPLPIALALEVWQVLVGVMVYPLGTAMLTEVLRDPILRDAPPSDTPSVVTAAGPLAASHTEAKPAGAISHSSSSHSATLDSAPPDSAPPDSAPPDSPPPDSATLDVASPVPESPNSAAKDDNAGGGQEAKADSPGADAN